MKRRTTHCAILLAGMLLFILTGCAPQGTATRPSPPVDYFNQSDTDIVERLPTTPPDARILYDDNALTYGDLRLPDTEADVHPLVILIHGGAWESSYTSEYLGQLSEALTEAGAATWNLEFRRLNNPGGEYPGMFLDVARGIDHSRLLADEYPIDLNRVVLLGHSSGGHLAAWAAGRENIPPESELHTESPLPVSGIVDLSGVLDLESAYAAGRGDVLDVLGLDDGTLLEDRAAHTSPIKLLPLGVPQTLIIGSEDNPWRLDSHARYQKLGRESGDDIELVTLEGANHFDVVDACSSAWTSILAAVSKYADLPADPEQHELSPTLCAHRN